jgi:hypothetical protein
MTIGESIGKRPMSPRTLRRIFESSDSVKTLLLSNDTTNSFDLAGLLAGCDSQEFLFPTADLLLEGLESREKRGTLTQSSESLKSGGAFASGEWGNLGRSYENLSFDKSIFFSSGGSSAADMMLKGYEAAGSSSAAGSSLAIHHNIYKSIMYNPIASSVKIPPMPPLATAQPNAMTVAAEKQETPKKKRPLSRSAKNTKEASRKKRTFKKRKVVPEVKKYTVYTELDVLFGRGGLSNTHPGNQRYRQEIEARKAEYRASSKTGKTGVAGVLVEHIKGYGGRFVEKDKGNDKWYIVPDVEARRKASQAFREDNTPEKRLEKRKRYGN